MGDRLQRRNRVTHEIPYLNAERSSTVQTRRFFLPSDPSSRLRWALLCWGLLALPFQGLAETEMAVFAVVSEAPKDKARVPAKILLDGALADTKLLPNETVVGNPIWRTLEICHAMKLEGSKTPDGFKVNSVRILDASMLPMTLQGFAGDCLIKKAVDIAPLVD
jgi:hypothetical protein